MIAASDAFLCASKRSRGSYVSSLQEWNIYNINQKTTTQAAIGEAQKQRESATSAPANACHGGQRLWRFRLLSASRMTAKNHYRYLLEQIQKKQVPFRREKGPRLLCRACVEDAAPPQRKSVEKAEQAMQ
jgi:hypothetical protein